MKKSLLVIFILLSMLFLSNSIYAAPFLTTNAQTGVITYKLTGSSWVPTSVSAQVDGSLKLDVASSSVGVNTVNMSACSSTDAVWGVLCSSALPFTFTKPAVPNVPSGAGLIP